MDLVRKYAFAKMCIFFFFFLRGGGLAGPLT